MCAENCSRLKFRWHNCSRIGLLARNCHCSRGLCHTHHKNIPLKVRKSFKMYEFVRFSVFIVQVDRLSGQSCYLNPRLDQIYMITWWNNGDLMLEWCHAEDIHLFIIIIIIIPVLNLKFLNINRIFVHFIPKVSPNWSFFLYSFFREKICGKAERNCHSPKINKNQPIFKFSCMQNKCPWYWDMHCGRCDQC